MDTTPADSDFTLRVKHVIARQCYQGTDPLRLPDQEPLVLWGVDSLRSIDLLLELESTFGITFPDEVMTAENFRTAGNISRMVALVVTSTRSGGS